MRGEVASNSSIAQSQVATLQQAVADANDTQNPNTDTQTTLQGNTKLHSITEQEMDMVGRFRTAFQTDAANIGRVAQAMEIQDQQLAQKGE
ncbi:TIGR04197 family type VII secretion effector [Listeria sp. FSL L7-1582]|uniref:TIGR04197 family type VII secretion effector n=1 Tax=Listeria portnoyi TaxID=2713504 RepID=UPI00164E88C7|nr:TIGR04197 family type VII secretion effector [Listeria portnoyi]MBC6309929.1 TIGR04197 family type VII secretion effector [Listeria portnoyi]